MLNRRSSDRNVARAKQLCDSTAEPQQGHERDQIEERAHASEDDREAANAPHAPARGALDFLHVDPIAGEGDSPNVRQQVIEQLTAPPSRPR